jgi:tetratricopeptide (TPR) repeat protein
LRAFNNDVTRYFWTICLLLAIPTSAFLSAQFLQSMLRRRFKGAETWLRLVLICLALLVSVLTLAPLFVGARGEPVLHFDQLAVAIASADPQLTSASTSDRDADQDPQESPRLRLWVLLLWLALTLGVPTAQRLWRAWKRYDIRRTWNLGNPRLVHLTKQQRTLLLALLGLATGIVGEFFVLNVGPMTSRPGRYLSILGPVAFLIVLLLSWILLSGFVAGGLLRRILESWQQSRQKSRLQRAGQAEPAPTDKSSADQSVPGEDKAPPKTLWTGFTTWLKRPTDRTTAPIVVLQVVLVIVLLIAVNELPYAGKLTLQPFNTFGFSEEEEELGELMAEEIYYNLELLRQQLQPAFLIPSPAAMGNAEIGLEILPMMLEESGLDAALTKSPDLELFGIKIPLGILMAPIQRPIRALFGIRSLNGSLQLEHNHYTAHAASPALGATWTAHFEYVPGEDGQVDLTSSLHANAVAELAKMIAFAIVSNDPGMSSMGMTDSWDAFDLFQRGEQAFQRYDKLTDYDALTEAIDWFRKATAKDPKFAIAYYHLGRALQVDGQPSAAMQAFQESLNLNPDLVTGYNVLAYHLRQFDRYYEPLPAPIVKEESPIMSVDSAHSRARALWRKVIATSGHNAYLPDRASAYYGLCLDAFDSEQDNIAYFYCKQASMLYHQLALTLPNDPLVKQSEASVYNTLGVLLNRIESGGYEFEADEWSCYTKYVTAGDELMPFPIYHSRHSETALVYYERALALQPNDRIIRCNAASTAWALGNKDPLNELINDPNVHLELAEEYQEQGKALGNGSVVLFRAALDEYQEALKGSPSNVSALKGYAYTVWVWQYYYTSGWLVEGPSTDELDKAEWSARKAVDLAAGRPPALTEAMVRARLGEVLLGQGRLEQAIEELTFIIDKDRDLIPHHPAVNEIRWDLVQAYYCDALMALHAGDLQEYARLKKQSKEYAEQIIDLERQREFRPFTNRRQDLLDTCFLGLDQLR